MSANIRDSDGKSLEGFPKVCPKCGGKLEHCFGVAFGGYGGYVLCGDLDDEDAGCEWWAKEFIPLGAEGT